MEKFRRIDTVFFGLLSLIAIFISEYFFAELSSGFFYSLKTAILLITLIRWKTKGSLAVFIAAVGSVLFTNLSMPEFLIFGVIGDMCLIIPTIFYSKLAPNYIAEKWYRIIGFIVASYVSLAIGKGIAIFILTSEITGPIDVFATSFLSMIIDIIVILVLSRVNGLVVDIEQLISLKGTNDGK